MNSKVGIVPEHGSLQFRKVKLSGFVHDVRIFRNNVETMREPCGNPRQPAVFARERLAVPLAKGGRTSPQIYENIENLADDNAHKLALRLFDLIMQSAKYTAIGIRMIVLDKSIRNTRLREGFLVIAFQEKTAIVFKYSRL